MDFVKEGHVQSGRVGFPLLLNKALKWGQEVWIWGFYKLDCFEEEHVHSGRVVFLLLLNKALKWGQEAWIWGFSKLDSFEEGHVQSGQVGFPLLPNKALAGVKKHGLDVCTWWTLWKGGMFRVGERALPCC